MTYFPAMTYFPLEDAMDDQQRYLENRRVAVQSMVARELFEDAGYVASTMNTHVLNDPIFGTLLVRLHAFVLAEKVSDEYRMLEFDWPATWWQHLKLALKRFVPQRFHSRWQVRLQTTKKPIHIEAYHNYPDARIALPEDRFGVPVTYVNVHPDWRDPEALDADTG